MDTPITPLDKILFKFTVAIPITPHHPMPKRKYRGVIA
jgi:hypothetical protein